jgi:hypothetical protein
MRALSGWALTAVLCALSCAAQETIERPPFSPLDPLSWVQLRYPGPLGKTAPRLVVSEEGELLLGGTVISGEQVKDFLPTARGDKKRIELLSAPGASFDLVYSLASAAIESGREDVSLLVSSRSGAPGLAAGVSFVGDPMIAVTLDANGALPSLAGREHHTSLLLVINSSLSIQKVLSVVESINGCEQRPCTNPTRMITLRRAGRGALDEYYNVGKGIYTKGVGPKKIPRKTPEEAKIFALQECPSAENASIVDVDCNAVNLPARRVLQGSTQKLEAAQTCYRVFMDCSTTGPLVVYIDGDSGDLLLEATD